MNKFTEDDVVLFTFVEGVSVLASKLYDGKLAKILYVNDEDEHPYTIKFADGVIDCVTAEEVRDSTDEDPSALGTRF